MEYANVVVKGLSCKSAFIEPHPRSSTVPMVTYTVWQAAKAAFNACHQKHFSYTNRREFSGIVGRNEAKAVYHSVYSAIRHACRYSPQAGFVRDDVGTDAIVFMRKYFKRLSYSAFHN